jgi:hypothetical protein
MKKILFILIIGCMVKSLSAQESYIKITHDFIKKDSSICNQLFIKVIENINEYNKMIICKNKIYLTEQNLLNDTLNIFIGDEILINDNLYKLPYFGTSYHYDVLPIYVHQNAVNSVINEIIFYNNEIINGIKINEIKIIQ